MDALTVEERRALRTQFMFLGLSTNTTPLVVKATAAATLQSVARKCGVDIDVAPFSVTGATFGVDGVAIDNATARFTDE